MEKYNNFIAEELVECTIETSIKKEIECEAMLSSQKLYNAIREIGFDLAIVDSFRVPCYFFLPEIHSIPYVTVEQAVDPLFSPSFVLPPYVPNIWNNYSDKMLFLQRVKNFVSFLYTHLSSNRLC